MKYCSKCGKSFPDNQVFCSGCGNSLNNSVMNSNGAGNFNGSSRNTNGVSNNGSNIWTPTILAGVGVVVAWFLSGLLGLVLGIVGVRMALQQKELGKYEYQHLPLTLTWVFAVIDVIFFLIAMAV